MSDLEPAVLEDIYRVVSLVGNDGKPIDPDLLQVELGMNTKEGYIISYILQDAKLIIMSKVMIGGPGGQADFKTIGQMN